MSGSLFDLSGKTALITGSSQGIGYTLARGLRDAGSEIVMNGRDREKLTKAAAKLGINRNTLHKKLKEFRLDGEHEADGEANS